MSHALCTDSQTASFAILSPRHGPYEYCDSGEDHASGNWSCCVRNLRLLRHSSTCHCLMLAREFFLDGTFSQGAQSLSSRQRRIRDLGAQKPFHAVAEPNLPAEVYLTNELQA